MATTYKLNADERGVIGCGYTHVAKLTYADFPATSAPGVAVYTLQPGDVVHPQAALYIKTAFSGGSGLSVTVGTTASATTHTVNIMQSKTITSSVAGDTFASLGPTATTEIGKSYAASTTIAVAPTVTGTYTAGEVWVFFTVGQLGALASGAQL